MNDREILDRLWEAHRETPFASLMMRRKLDLLPQEDDAARKLLGSMADSGEVRSGYRIKRVASTMCDYLSLLYPIGGAISRQLAPEIEPKPPCVMLDNMLSFPTMNFSINTRREGEP